MARRERSDSHVRIPDPGTKTKDLRRPIHPEAVRIRLLKQASGLAAGKRRESRQAGQAAQDARGF